MTEFFNPYNFVRLMGNAADNGRMGNGMPPPHDRFSGLTGKITCTAKVETPLFISDGHAVETDRGKHKTYRFFEIGGNKIVPGSALRGMVRNVFEAVTNSCMTVLDDKRLSYRAEGKEAQKFMPARISEITEDCIKIELLKANNADGKTLLAAWLPKYQCGSSAPREFDKTYKLNVIKEASRDKKLVWAFIEKKTHRTRRFKYWQVAEVAQDKTAITKPITDQSVQAIVKGYIYITNQNADNKHDERFFVCSDTPNNICINNKEEVKRLKNEWKILITEAFERHRDDIKKIDKESGGHRPFQYRGRGDVAYSSYLQGEESKDLKVGDLLYVFHENNNIKHVAPVSIPRILHEKSIGDLAENYMKCKNIEKLCPACRVFGWVKGGEGENNAYMGRVRFSHGTFDADAGKLKLFQNGSEVTLTELSSPKPTNGRFYLMRKNGKLLDRAFRNISCRYSSANKIRGRKRYLHHCSEGEFEAIADKDGKRKNERNRTVKNVVDEGSKFNFAVHFENLSKEELGALLWSIQLQDGGVHKLGYAKPLGFGAVSISIDQEKSYILDMQSRYEDFSKESKKPLSDKAEEWINCFRKAVCGSDDKDAFERLENIADLLAIAKKKTKPVHYPRPQRSKSPEMKMFEWYIGNKRESQKFDRNDRIRIISCENGPHFTIGLPEDNSGLSIVDKNGDVS